LEPATIHGQHTLMSYVSSRQNTAHWLRNDVEKTECAKIDVMLHTLTRRICTDGQKAKPEETLKKILKITNKMVEGLSSVSSPADGEHTAGSLSSAAAAEERKQRIKELNDYHRQLFVIHYI
jgi:hypothetical protein